MRKSTYYLAKRVLFLPYVWYMRWKRFGKSEVKYPPVRIFFEANYYQPEFTRFFKECVKDKDFLKRADLDENSIIFDVGAYIGEWSKGVAELYNNPHIYAFEPDEESYNTALDALGGNDRFKLAKYGLSGKNEEVVFYSNKMGSSIYHSWSPNWSSQNRSKIQLRDVSEVIDELGVSNIDLMKINIEGGEYSLLNRLIESGAVKKCVSIMVQYHEWIPRAHRMRKKINKELALTHDVEWSYKFIWEKWKRKPGIANES